MKIYENLAALEAMLGLVIGSSDWLTIDQRRIDDFAAVTGDTQWIHVDPQRAARGRFGATVAHGFLTLGLLPYFGQSAFGISGISSTVNYGVNRVRFPAPVPVGSRLRAHFKLVSLHYIDGGAQEVSEVTVERESQRKPVCVAEAVSRHYI